MRIAICRFAICFVSMAALAAQRPDYSGTWTFNPDKSKNIGMMAQMKMTQNYRASVHCARCDFGHKLPRE